MIQPKDKSKECVDLAAISLTYLTKVCKLFNITATHQGELASFIAFAIAFPQSFLILVDTYDVLK